MFSNVLLKISTSWCTVFPRNKLGQSQFSIARLNKSVLALL